MNRRENGPVGISLGLSSLCTSRRSMRSTGLKQPLRWISEAIRRGSNPENKDCKSLCQRLLRVRGLRVSDRVQIHQLPRLIRVDGDRRHVGYWPRWRRDLCPLQKAVQQTSEDIAAGQRSHEDRSHTVILEMPRKVRYSISGMGSYDLNRYMR